MKINRCSILIMFHCEQNTGYAIESLEDVFLRSAVRAGFDAENIYWSYSRSHEKTDKIFEIDYFSLESAKKLQLIIEKHGISTILAFDMPIPTLAATYARKAGVQNIVAYWGASMSSISRGLKLQLKKLGCYIREHQSPHKFIFESRAMQLTATQGRGISERKTVIIPLGVDTNIYRPSLDEGYIKKCFGIPENRFVVFYSGHMEERKGIRTIAKAAHHLSKTGRIKNIHFVLCGNKGDEAETYINEIREVDAIDHVSFVGYRTDIPKLMSSSDMGVIASTGWDSFTKSSVEMLSSGLPLIVSNLGGLTETTKHGETGALFPPADCIALSDLVYMYSKDRELLVIQSEAARNRALTYFKIEDQIDKISKML